MVRVLNAKLIFTEHFWSVASSFRNLLTSSLAITEKLAKI